ncbi:uncharacterized protein B0H18DRAFT_1117458 [Fomitopsis serialis]|uniref:uncharacterized protein n=1 Tax=Fomitopsis serialis TaxID=139415 RepID=UPI0020075F4C|nr:uncharacterized protein B0H18DRAFT_1117458 [Neoantrodia serialis]KAH9929424.1 hypothetical protein B0H18DRAFT_1117458 [Neoantrodia serialis]
MPALIPVDNLLGAAFIGIVLSTVLYGVSCLQTYLYYTHYSKGDSLRLKLFVSLVVALDTLHVALISTAYYHYTVTNFGDSSALKRVTWSLAVQITFGGLVGLLVQLFFAKRIYVLGKRRLVIPGIIGLLGFVELGCSIAYTIAGYSDHYFSVSGKEGHADAYTSTALTANIVCDLLIAGCTVYYLREGRTAFYRTNKAVTLLMTYALSTCILAMIFSLVCLITWVTMNQTLIYAVFYWILIRIYPCSFLSTLNSREASLSGQGSSRSGPHETVVEPCF